MIRKKIMKVLTGIMIGSMMLTGCKGGQASNQNVSSNNEDNKDNNDNKEGMPDRKESNATYGKVTSIDGNKITIQLGSIARMGSNGNGERPDMEGGNPPEGMSGEMPEGTPGKMPEGTPPAMENGKDGNTRPDMKMDFEATEETKTITIEDESVLKVRNGRDTTQASLADIKENSILRITYQENSETIESITIMSNQESTNQESTSQENVDQDI